MASFLPSTSAIAGWCELISNELKPLSRSAYQLLHDGSLALADVEANGIRIDVDRLDRTIEKADLKIKEHASTLKQDSVWREWVKWFGEGANLGSRSQLGMLLFSVLEFPPVGHTRTGRDQTDEDSLLGVDSDFVRLWVKTEKLKKMRSTFLQGIRKEVVDGFLRPSFNLHLARTYRSSSDRPNFQNFPIRDKKISKPIRSCFIPRDGHVLVEADFSSLEVRISACYNHDPVLINYIEDPSSDMHRDMACQCFKLEEDELVKEIRFYAKNQFVFPEFYGSYYIHCAPQLWESAANLTTRSGIPLRDHLEGNGINRLGRCDPKVPAERGTFERHIKNVESDFWGRRFKVYAQWKERWWQEYQRCGGFRMLTGFVVQGVHKKNDVINYPIQGSAFHCELWTLIQLNNWLKKHKMKSKIVGQIHDSIVGDVHRSELQDYLAKVKQISTVDIRKAWDWIIVPLEIECEVGEKNWFEKKEVKL